MLVPPHGKTNKILSYKNISKNWKENIFKRLKKWHTKHETLLVYNSDLWKLVQIKCVFNCLKWKSFGIIDIIWFVWNKIRPANKLWGCRSFLEVEFDAKNRIWTRWSVDQAKCLHAVSPFLTSFHCLSRVSIKAHCIASPSWSGWMLGPGLSNMLRVGSHFIQNNNRYSLKDNWSPIMLMFDVESSSLSLSYN